MEKEKWILIHVEVQGYNDNEFSKRMFTYYYRILDRYEKDIMAIAILTDSNKKYKPYKYETKFYNTELRYKYNSFKVLDQNEKELENNNNPFALIVLAGLYVIKSNKSKDEEKKYSFKLKLAKLLKMKNYSKEKRRNIFIFVESIIKLTAQLELQFENDTNYIFEEEENMPLTIEDTNLFQVKNKIARTEGRVEGKVEGKIEIAKKMLRDGLSLEMIAKYVDLNIKKLKEFLDIKNS